MNRIESKQEEAAAFKFKDLSQKFPGRIKGKDEGVCRSNCILTRAHSWGILCNT
jgi:hypothetical protein